MTDLLDDGRHVRTEPWEEDAMLTQAVGLSLIALVIGAVVAAALPWHVPGTSGR